MTNDQTVTHPIGSLRQMVADDIERKGSFGSFMIRNGKLADLLDELQRHRTAHSGEGRSKGAGEDRSFQVRVHEWMLECFGPEIEADRQERADRFIEEALELAQTMPGFNAGRAHALVDYVFGRPVGERHQEVGGVMVTLAALCNTVGLRIDEEAERELARVWTKIEAIREKQAAKPTGSALPVALSAPQGEVERLREALVAIRQRGIERDLKWAGMNAHDIARAALAQPEAGGER